MTIKLFLLLLIVLVSAMPGTVNGQNCAVVEIKPPLGMIEPGTAFDVEAIAGGAGDGVSYNWIVSNGAIVSGQGTKAIRVDTEGVPGGSTIQINLDLVTANANPNCPLRFSETVALGMLPEAILVDEFSTVSTTCEDGNARLDALFVELSNNPNDRALIIIYDSAKKKRAAWYREQILTNFIKMRKFETSRITFLLGPFREDANVQFWRLPPGAADPTLLEGNITAPDEEEVIPPTKPYLFAERFVDGLWECQVPMFDLGEYAQILNAEPKSTGRIVIGESSRRNFTQTRSELTAELAKHGVEGSRIVFAYKYVRPNRALEKIELWVNPSPGPRR